MTLTIEDAEKREPFPGRIAAARRLTTRMDRLARMDAVLRSVAPRGDERELAHRADHGIDVSLYWNVRTNRLTVMVRDMRLGNDFEFEVEADEALDAYRHPFAYAT